MSRLKQAGLVWRTIRHLTVRQCVYQVLTRLRGRARPGRVRLRLPTVAPTGYFMTAPEADKFTSWTAGTFTFLNQSAPTPVIDWNYANYGKLWTYNLNYFDCLNQPGRSAGAVDSPTLTLDKGLWLIHDFISQTNVLKDGLEPYPTALRIINWVQFLSRNQIRDDGINRHLYAQTDLLHRRLEYHLAGNHLLENGFALLTAALYFRHDAWLGRAAKLVRAELSTQILTDGGHDERSPMYHQLVLDRLLDVLLAVKHDTWHNDPTLLSFLEEKGSRMLRWLDAITFRNGDVPMLNDAAPGIAPETAQLRAKANRLGLADKPCAGWAERSVFRSSQTTDTGYRKFTFPRYELLADVGSIGPDHQPGHAHADTLSFVLYVDDQPLIVDSGTLTYERGTRRAWERSTAAHNTVDRMGISSSEVWAGFRVGRRARATVLTDTPTTLTARHDGYRHLGVIHERTWSAGATCLRIRDRLIGAKEKTTQHPSGVARLHFHPDVSVSLTETGIGAGVVRITFASDPAPELRLVTYGMADGFNHLRTAPCVEITFTNYLETVLILTE